MKAIILLLLMSGCATINVYQNSQHEPVDYCSVSTECIWDVVDPGQIMVYEY